MLRVKYERIARGWSQVALAFHARISIGDVGRIENGRLLPYACQLEKLATALAIPPDELLKEVEHAQPTLAGQERAGGLTLAEAR